MQTSVSEASGLIAETHLFDTRVFYPHVQSYQSRSLPSFFRTFENEKKREYGVRITEVEHGSFTQMIQKIRTYLLTVFYGMLFENMRQLWALLW